MQEIVATLRMLNENATRCPCPFDRYIMFFTQNRWALIEALIMGISRITDRRKDCLHFGIVLATARQTPPSNVKTAKLIEAQQEYDKLRRSKELKAIKNIRHETIAHAANKQDPDECLDGVTWGEVYGVVDKLSNIFNIANDAKLWTHRVMPSAMTYVTGVGQRDLVKDTTAMIKALETISHNEKLHSRLIRQAEEHQRVEKD